MLEAVYIWISIAFMFLLGSVWGEADVKFGAILVPLFSGIFWIVGWLPNEYMALALQFAITLGVMSFLKAQFRDKIAGGSAGGFTIWRIMSFIIFLQVAITFVCGLSYVFGTQGSTTVQLTNTTVNNYNLVTAQEAYGSSTNIEAVDAITTSLTLMWMGYNAVWAMLWGIVTMYPTLVTVFHMPSAISAIVTCGVYVLLAIEVFVILWFRTRPPAV